MPWRHITSISVFVQQYIPFEENKNDLKYDIKLQMKNFYF